MNTYRFFISGPSLSIRLTTSCDLFPASVGLQLYFALDFLIKPFSKEALLNAVRAAIEKDVLQERLLELTGRERQIFRHVVSDQLNNQIALDLRITEKTVKTHRTRVMRKWVRKYWQILCASLRYSTITNAAQNVHEEKSGDDETASSLVDLSP